jgi:hypothetical protein
MAIVYRKTSKGIAEVETRAHRLLPRLRGALILVDGKRTDDELTRMVLADPAGTLKSLLTDGFIEVLTTLAERPTEAAPVAASRATASAGATLESLRREAARQLNHQLGPLADEVSLKIERAKSMPELQPLLVQAAQMLHRLKGTESAQAFATRFIGAERE